LDYRVGKWLLWTKPGILAINKKMQKTNENIEIENETLGFG
jgi:hypothetical protein